MTTAIVSAATVRIGRQSFPFTTNEDVSAAYRSTIDKLGIGGSETPPCDILDGAGRVIGYVSYNGRVWNGNRKDWQPGRRPIYDPTGSAY